ncbi:OmpA family protein, partial [Actinomadura sp. KC06]|uniref:OmpA family protein n=1 Tax=Actinomadura sp. KC06 TaxID=2530369 RepID=UPI00140478AB
MLTAVTAGLPWLFVTLAGSPIPDRIPGREEIFSALSRRDDGTLFLGFLTYVAWAVWLLWITLLLLEVGARLRGRSAPHIPGLDGPQRLAALLITTLGATVIGTTAAMSRVSTLPAISQEVTAATAPPYAQSSTADDSTIGGPVGGHGSPPAHLTTSVGPMAGETTPWQASRPQTHKIVVQFAFNSAKLSASARDGLAQTARTIRAKADPARPIVIVGHTDSRGPADYNQQLSVRRARAAREVLGELAAHGFRFEVSGKGERAPIAAEAHADGSDDPSGRARNRRVEISYSLKAAPAPPASPTTRPPREQDGAGEPGRSASPPST